MAKVLLAGHSVVITSSLKLEDIRKAEKYCPDALILMGGKDNEEPIFRISTKDTNGSISKYGAEYSRTTYNKDGYATMTLGLNVPDGVDTKEYIADKIGRCMVNLEALEEKIPAVLEDLNKKRAEFIENIDTIG